MLDSMEEVLIRFQHNSSQKRQDQPYPHIKPNYGEKLQYYEDKYSSPILVKYGKNVIQGVTGYFQYHARDFDFTMLTALGSIATQESKPIENTMKKVK